MWTMALGFPALLHWIFVPMELLRFIRKVLLNKYVLALAAFCTWVLFFDKNDFFTQRQRHTELKMLNQKISYYKEQIAAAQKELQALENDPSTLEKYAREKYYMKRDNEDIYIIETPANQPNKP
jgi:cell division protein FtsB